MKQPTFDPASTGAALALFPVSKMAVFWAVCEHSPCKNRACAVPFCYPIIIV